MPIARAGVQACQSLQRECRRRRRRRPFTRLLVAAAAAGAAPAMAVGLSPPAWTFQTFLPSWQEYGKSTAPHRVRGGNPLGLLWERETPWLFLLPPLPPHPWLPQSKRSRRRGSCSRWNCSRRTRPLLRSAKNSVEGTKVEIGWRSMKGTSLLSITSARLPQPLAHCHCQRTVSLRVTTL